MLPSGADTSYSTRTLRAADGSADPPENACDRMTVPGPPVGSAPAACRMPASKRGRENRTQYQRSCLSLIVLKRRAEAEHDVVRAGTEVDNAP